MLSKGAWFMASRRRPHLLQRFFEACSGTGVSTAGRVMVQKDEFEELRKDYTAMSLPPGWGFVPTRADGMGNKWRECWPLMKDLDWFGLLCDDIVPCTKGWDASLVGDLTGWNFVSCNYHSSYSNSPVVRMAGAVAFSGALVRAVGYFYPDGFWHQYTDDVWEYLGRTAKCWEIRDDIIVEHRHPFEAGDSGDETHTHSYARGASDRAAYELWMKQDRQPALDAILALKAAKGVAPASTRADRSAAGRRGNPVALLELGNQQVLEGRPEQAIFLYRRALALKPDFAAAHNNLGILLSRQGRWDEAEACFRHALAFEPEGADPHLNLGNLMLQQGRLEPAAEHYRQALARQPDHADAHLNLGVVLLEQGLPDQAERQFRLALASHPQDAQILNNLGLTLFRLGRPEEAAVYYDQALRGLSR